ATGWSIGFPSACASSTSHPPPTPSSKRPFESTSIVATCFASLIGCVVISGTTATPRRTRSVAAATKAIVVIASGHELVAFQIGRPSALYGYRGANVTGTTVCEFDHSESNPSDSAARAYASTASRLVAVSTGRSRPTRTAEV